MSESPTPPKIRPYARATSRGLGLAGLIAVAAVVVFAVGAVGDRPTGTLPGGEAWSPTLGASVGSTGNPSSAGGGIVDFVISPDRRTLYALQAPGIVAYDAESLDRTGEIDLGWSDPRTPVAMVISPDGSGIFALGDDTRLTFASLRAETFGRVAEVETWVAPRFPNYSSATYQWPTIVADWRPFLQSSPDGSSAYILDVGGWELLEFPVDDDGFDAPRSVPIEPSATLGGPGTALTVDPVSGRIYVTEDGGAVRVFAPSSLEQSDAPGRSPAAWRATAFSEDGTLVYDLSTRFYRDDTLFVHDGSLCWYDFGTLSCEPGVTLEDDGTIVHESGDRDRGIPLEQYDDGTLRLSVSDARLEPLGDLTIGLPPQAPVLETTPTAALVLTNGSRGGMALVDVTADVVVAELETASRSAQWAVGADFHHLYYLDSATDPYNLHRFDVSAPAPEHGRYRWTASALLLLAVVVVGVAVTQRRWRPVVARASRWVSSSLRRLHKAPQGEPTVRGELAKLVGVVGAFLILFPSLFSFGDSVVEGWGRVALVLAMAVASALGLRWTLVALVIGSALAWVPADHAHPVAVGYMLLGLVLGLFAAAMTPARRPVYGVHDPRRLRIVTLAAVFFFWVPFLDIVLAHIAQLGAERRGKLDGRVAFWTTIAAWGVTILVLVFYGYIFGRLSTGIEDAAGAIVGQGPGVAA